MNTVLRRLQVAATASLALVLTALVPHAWTDHGSNGGTGTSEQAGPEQQLALLHRAPLLAAAKRVLPKAIVTTSQFSKGSKSRTDYLDSRDDKNPVTTGSIDLTYNPDGTVWMVSCDATTATPATNVALRFCTGLPYAGADPVAIRAWVARAFTTPVEGSRLQQQRSHASWILSVDNFGDGLTYDIDIQPPY